MHGVWIRPGSCSCNVEVLQYRNMAATDADLDEMPEPDDVKAERRRAELLWNQMQQADSSDGLVTSAILLVGLRKVCSWHHHW